MRDPFRWAADRLAARIVYRVRPEYPETRAVYQSIALMRDRRACAGPLGACEMRVFSQNGEDGVLGAIFDRIGTTDHRFVEFGVGTGLECNTRFLAEVHGWGGWYFEPSDDFASVERLYAQRDDITTVRKAITPDNVGEAFRDARIPEEFDLLSIDIDGQDYWVWSAIAHRPRVVVIEYNAALAGRLVEPLGESREFDRTDCWGASLDAIEALGTQKGYTLVHVDLAAVNAFFVCDDLVDRVGEVNILRRAPNPFLRGRGWAHKDGRFVEV